MKYLLSIIVDESKRRDSAAEGSQDVMKAWDDYTRDAIDAGVHLGGEGLQPSETATTVRFGEGDPLVTDGPFAETKEQLGGYYLLDCKDLDEALAWAKRVPMPDGGVEVRPVMDYQAAGSTEHTNAAEAAR